MDRKYAIFNAVRAARGPFARRTRAARMRRFEKLMGIREGIRIIDLGGTAKFWDDCRIPLRLTIVNLPGTRVRFPGETPHEIEYVEGDACEMPFVASGEYDLAFSNSVIEHVGPPKNQARLAAEMHRVAPRHWVQTPSIWFPIEAHNHMPFWWFYPESLQQRMIARWKKKLPGWTEMIEGTTVILRKDMETMFPESRLWVERIAGIPKSYVFYR